MHAGDGLIKGLIKMLIMGLIKGYSYKSIAKLIDQTS